MSEQGNSLEPNTVSDALSSVEGGKGFDKSTVFISSKVKGLTGLTKACRLYK